MRKELLKIKLIKMGKEFVQESLVLLFMSLLIVIQRFPNKGKRGFVYVFYQILSTLAPVDAVERYTQLTVNPLHLTNKPGILSMDIQYSKDIIATAGVDSNAVIFNRPSDSSCGMDLKMETMIAGTF